MVTLKLKGPRRRESERVKAQPKTRSPIEPEDHDVSPGVDPEPKTRRRAARTSTKSNTPVSIRVGTERKKSGSASMDARSPLSDTIAVHHRTAPVELSDDNDETDSVDVGPLYIHERVMSPFNNKSSNTKQMPTTSAKAKIPASVQQTTDLEMFDADDTVEEYDFRNEADRADDDDDGRDTMWYKKSGKKVQDIITISSDDGSDEIDAGWDLSVRPWRELTRDGRIRWETMYCKVTDYPLHGDWGVTEDYQEAKDREMLRYMEDFPLPEWVLPQHVVHDAYNRMLERTRWRSLGIHIYGHRSSSGWMPDRTPGLPMMQAQSVQNQRPLTVPTGSFSGGPSAISRRSQALQSPSGYTPRNLPPPQGITLPPPHQALHSQSDGKKIVPWIETIGRSLPSKKGKFSTALSSPYSQTGATHLTGGMHPPSLAQSASAVPQASKRKGKGKKVTTPDIQAPPPPPRVPPYPKRDKPVERPTANKARRQNMRRHAEAEEFPWNSNIDFQQAAANATWDDSIYDPQTLKDMAETRKDNESIITAIDAAETERQRQGRARKREAMADASSETEPTKPVGRRKSTQKSNSVDGGTVDPYHSGHFEFTPKDQLAVLALGNKTPDEVMMDAERGKISIEDCADLMICWNPGKKGMTQDLQQARFSIKDTLLTRQQLAYTPVLVERAAQCIVDFCPDMLWRGMLLRIASEAGYGNKAVRDRMCLNGNYCDKATITKRIGSALGQKQQQSASKKAKTEPVGLLLSGDPSLEKVKGYMKGEDDYYNENVKDFGDYCAFFGHRTSHRSQLQLNQAGTKRKAVVLDAEGNGAAGINPQFSRAARPQIQPKQTAQSTEAMEISDEVETSEVEGEDSEEEMDSDGDAVSVQSDTLLDQMDDD